MTIVVVARLAIVPYISGKISCDQFFHITAAATDNLYPLGFKHILRSLSHISCQHDSHSHLTQNGGNAALASASLRGSHLADSCNLAVNDIKYRIICTMTEVVIHVSVSCWYCYLHILSFIQTYIPAASICGAANLQKIVKYERC